MHMKATPVSGVMRGLTGAASFSGNQQSRGSQELRVWRGIALLHIGKSAWKGKHRACQCLQWEDMALYGRDSGRDRHQGAVPNEVISVREIDI